VPLTVNQLASRICSDPKKLPVVVERIRNWTRAGLLLPIERRPGRGASRLFGDGDLPAAAVLNTLSETAGFTGREILYALQLLPHAADRWRKDRNRQLLLELTWVSLSGTKSPPKFVAYLREDGEPLTGARVAIVLSLNPIFAAVKWDNGDVVDQPGAAPEPPRRKK
jgi:hypothetical protein